MTKHRQQSTKFKVKWNRSNMESDLFFLITMASGSLCIYRTSVPGALKPLTLGCCHGSDNTCNLFIIDP